jgi:hypothetical protein
MMSFLPVTCTSPVEGQSCYAFNVLNTAEAVGLVGDGNRYLSTALTSPRFIYGIGNNLDLGGFRTASGTEATSAVVAP